jgi:hypothetical protein
MAHPKDLKKNGRAFEIINKAKRVVYIDNNYKLSMFKTPSQITATSYLVVGKLEPKIDKGLCTFILRWDEKALSLDVDVENCPDKKLVERFKSDKDQAYFGHHPTKIPNAGWSFDTKIVWDSKRIFDGAIKFSLSREMELTNGVKF